MIFRAYKLHASNFAVGNEFYEEVPCMIRSQPLSPIIIETLLDSGGEDAEVVEQLLYDPDLEPEGEEIGVDLNGLLNMVNNQEEV